MIFNLASVTSLLALISATSLHVASAPVEQERSLVRRGNAACRGNPDMGHLAHKVSFKLQRILFVASPLSLTIFCFLSQYYVNTETDTLGNWGQGLLDNLRGQCGVITDWQASTEGGGVSTTLRKDLFPLVFSRC